VNECDNCMNLCTDEDNEVYCGVDMDEDEYRQVAMSRFKTCPYYRPGNEYDIVKKQI